MQALKEDSAVEADQHRTSDKSLGPNMLLHFFSWQVASYLILLQVIKTYTMIPATMLSELGKERESLEVKRKAFLLSFCRNSLLPSLYRFVELKLYRP